MVTGLEGCRGQKPARFEHGALKDELLRLSFREVGGQLRVDHPSDGHDDHAVAVGMAALAAEITKPRWATPTFLSLGQGIDDSGQRLKPTMMPRGSLPTLRWV